MLLLLLRKCEDGVGEKHPRKQAKFIGSLTVEWLFFRLFTVLTHVHCPRTVRASALRLQRRGEAMSSGVSVSTRRGGNPTMTPEMIVARARKRKQIKSSVFDTN